MKTRNTKKIELPPADFSFAMHEIYGDAFDFSKWRETPEWKTFVRGYNSAVKTAKAERKKMTSKEILMPNGCILTPGGRIRMTRKQACQIPEYVMEAHGLELDDKAAGWDTEVVVWPIRAPDGNSELPLNKESYNKGKSGSME